MAEKYTVVGKSLPHIDAKEKVTGRLKFTGDLPALPGMLYARVLRSPHAHARIKEIDTTKAEALPGVGAVITYKDCPEKELIGSGFNWTSRVLEEKVRFVGDEVAAVAAVDEDTAEKALDLIEVEYEELPAVFTVEEAIKQGAPQILPHSESNAQATDLSEWGNVDKGFKEADFIVEHRTKMGGQAHAPLDRNACIASLEGDRLTVWTSTHSLDVTHMLIVNGMEMPYHKVRVFSPPTGGSFGLHWDNKYMLIPCYLSRKARKPVKLELSREEIMTTVKRREMPVTHVKLGVKKDGTLIFSNNCKKFKLDQTALKGLSIENITESTISEDFKRKKTVHNCWIIKKQYWTIKYNER